MISPEATAKLQPLWRRPLVVRLLLIALFAEIGYAVLNISTMPVYLKYDRGFGESVIGLVLVAFLLSEAVFKGPMGHLADHHGRRTLMILGPGMTVATALLSFVVPHGAGGWEVLAFVLLRALDGVGAAMLWPAAFAMMSDSVEDHERQSAMSLLNLCYMLGIALALPIGGIANDLTNTRWASLVLAAVLFVAVAISCYIYVPRLVKTSHSEEAAELGEFKIGDFLKSARQIPAYLTLAIIIYAGIGFPMGVIKLFAEEQLRMTETQFGGLVFPAAIAMAVLSVPLSRFGERLGRARAVHVGIGLCTLGLGVIALGSILPMFRSALVMSLGAIPVGIGFLMAIPAWMASVSDIDPRRRAANLGAVMTAQGIGAIIGAPIGSAFYEHFQRISPDFGRYSPFIGCATCVGIGWLISLRILREPS
ncbi:MAG TPA: MFS transporter [Fimbriimonadaceae bacterium]|nr:MFS transporter [Fimbriimonadaceae bacterium]